MKYLMKSKFFTESKKDIKLFERNAFLIDDAGNVDFGKTNKKLEKKKFEILQKYLGVNCVSGEMSTIAYDLDFGTADRSGMDILFVIDGRIKNNKYTGIVILGYDSEKGVIDALSGDSIEFDFNYHPLDKNGNFDWEQFESNVIYLKKIFDDPEPYINAKKYNL